MSTELAVPNEPRHVVAIIGGAVAGSEAAALCAERGMTALVIEQNDRPFGKIEDGLPRWHEKLRNKEYEKIGENFARPGVYFLPSTTLGEDLSVEQLVEDWGVSAVLLASGAWRDRPLPVEGADEYVDKGLVYQNPFVYWYNHYPDDGFNGQRFEILDGAAVVGGGLASIDVVKIINFELYKAAFARKGIELTTLEIEHAGLPKLLEKHGLTRDELGVKGCTLYYRREKNKMPLASPPPNANEKQLAKIGQVREKVMDKVIDKYFVHFEGNHAPVDTIVEGGRLVGLRFEKTQTVDGKLQKLGEFVDVRTPMVVSSIGSVPRPIKGVPMKGELIHFDDWDTGEVNGLPRVFGLGNALTGKGNIKESRKNARQISQQVAEQYLGVGEGGTPVDLGHEAAREAAAEAMDAAQQRAPLSPSQQQRVMEGVKAQWERTGYDGNYAAWIEKVMPRGSE